MHGGKIPPPQLPANVAKKTVAGTRVKNTYHKNLAPALPKNQRQPPTVVWRLIFWPILYDSIETPGSVSKTEHNLIYTMGQKLSSKLLFISSPNSGGFYNISKTVVHRPKLLLVIVACELSIDTKIDDLG